MVGFETQKNITLWEKLVLTQARIELQLNGNGRPPTKKLVSFGDFYSN